MVMGIFTRDREWARQAFLVRSEHLTRQAKYVRTATTADFKFTDTTLGGNFAINPPPQFTRSADLKVGGTAVSSKGMGRYYSEAIDDHSQLIHLRMGTPVFNSLTTFFGNFYNSAAGQMARTGRASSAFYELGRAAGFVVSIMSWKLLAVRAIGAIINYALEMPTSKYYYSRPAMHSYWTAVQTLVNQYAVNRGIVPRIGGKYENVQRVAREQEFTEKDLLMLHNKVPDIFTKSGQIDVYAMAHKAQRLARKRTDSMATKYDSSAIDVEQAIVDVHTEKLADTNKRSYLQYMQTWLETEQSKPKHLESKAGADLNVEPMENRASGGVGLFEKAKEYFKAEADDGSQFATFRVNYTGSVSESFSNQVGESSIASKLNGFSADKRSLMFDLAGGNIAPGIDQILGAVKSFIGGAAESIGISGLLALGGAAFVDIPKMWQNSTASLPRSTYTMHLVSPYGNAISQLMNMYIPLCMILAAALPLSSGKQSYTSPFLIELYDKGRAQTRMGMIDSLSITRGTGNLGFNEDNHAMGIEVSFSVTDMSSVMHMPISQGITLGEVASTAVAATAGGIAGGAVGGAAAAVTSSLLSGGIFDDNTVFSDYMAILASQGIGDQINTFRKLKLRLTHKLAQWNSWASVSNLTGFIGDSIPGRIASVFFAGTIRD